MLNRRVCRDNIALKCQQWLLYSCSCCYYTPFPPHPFPHQEAAAGNDKWNENETLEVTFANIQSKNHEMKIRELGGKNKKIKKCAEQTEPGSVENASKKMGDAAAFRRHNSSSHLRLGRGLGAASEAAPRLTALQSGASPERCRRGVSAELPGALETRKAALCFWMAVLALCECFLALSQDPAPGEGRLMTASHGKALQRQRAEERGIEWKRRDEGGRGGRESTASMWVIGASVSKKAC